MNEGIKILLARMDSHPEEFFSAHDTLRSKWAPHLAAVLGGGSLRATYVDIGLSNSMFTEDEINAVREKLAELRRGKFVASVVANVFEPNDDPRPETQSSSQYQTNVWPPAAASLRGKWPPTAPNVYDTSSPAYRANERYHALSRDVRDVDIEKLVLDIRSQVAKTQDVEK